MAENTEKKTTQQQPEAQENRALSDEQLDRAAGGTFVNSWKISGQADDRPTEAAKAPGKLEMPNLTFYVPESD